jgi:phytoene synthase
VTGPAARLAHRSLAKNSKSFALAGRLLPGDCRDDAAVIYAWCRDCDDAIDLAPAVARRAALARMRRELHAIYAGEPQIDPLLASFAEVVHRRRIPEPYPRALLDGMGMDLTEVRYQTFDELVPYCFRVAGTVGLMMCHVMGVRDPAALRHAAHLGIAMQLTNICRDVAEDWRNGRLYLPRDLLGNAATDRLDPTAAAGAVRALLDRARAVYRSGDRGLPSLPFRCAIAIRAARLIYADIGRAIAKQAHAVSAPRAYVSLPRKLALTLRAVITECTTRLTRLLTRRTSTSTSTDTDTSPLLSPELHP